MPIRRAMLFAAGLGTRLRPLTDSTPKPLVRVGGRALLDYNLEHFVRHGCERVVINTHHLADQVQAHVAALQNQALQVLHEAELLETGGGIVHALPLLGGAPFFSANSDAFWLDGAQPALQRLEQAFEETRMDALLLLVPHEHAVGYQGAGDFSLAADGQLQRGGQERLVFSGLQVLHPRLFTGRPVAPFSLRELYAAAQQDSGLLRRMYGLVHDGTWMHVGSLPELERVQEHLDLLRRDRSKAPG